MRILKAVASAVLVSVATGAVAQQVVPASTWTVKREWVRAHEESLAISIK
jgi:hypothetical protein